MTVTDNLVRPNDILPNFLEAELQADRLSDLYSSPPIPVLEIANAEGVRVAFSSFGKLSADVAGFCDFEERTLYVNSEDPIIDQLFTIAHELGHWVMHRHLFQSDPTKYTALPRMRRMLTGNRHEIEADAFAEYLLVPKRLLLPIKNAPVAELASIFAVSQALMEDRLKHV